MLVPRLGTWGYFSAATPMLLALYTSELGSYTHGRAAVLYRVFMGLCQQFQCLKWVLVFDTSQNVERELSSNRGSSQIFLIGFLLDLYIRWMQLENTNKIKKQSYIHLKQEKQLKMCDPQLFCAFKHWNEPPTSNSLSWSDMHDFRSPKPTGIPILLYFDIIHLPASLWPQK